MKNVLDTRPRIVYTGNMKSSFFHITTVSRLPGIKRQGLLPSKALDKRKAVYAVHEDQGTWALSHVAARHKVELDELVVLIVVDDEHHWVKGGKNYFWNPRTIPWKKVTAILSPGDLCQNV